MALITSELCGLQVLDSDGGVLPLAITCAALGARGWHALSVCGGLCVPSRVFLRDDATF